MKKIILLVGLAVVLVVPLAACSKLPFQKTTSIAAPTTADVTRGTIEITVTSSGTINLPNKTQMGFSGSLTGSGAGNAILKELNVSPGTSVKQGQVIARMDTAGIERDLQRYRNSLETAKLNLDKAKEPAKATDITKAEASVTSAKSSLDFARDDLEDAKKPYTDNDFRVAEAAVRNAKTALAVAESQLEISKKDWDISYQSEMREIFQVSTPGRISGTLSAGLLGLLPGQTVVPQTEQQLKLVEELGLLIKQTELSISQSENSIVKARDTLAAADYALSEMLSKKDGDPLTIKQKERSILNAEVSLQNAEINLAQLK
ncbi:MAG: hypothetical protein U1D67_06220, partial [Dehalococcoidia bacterium]|nr:hypothetical protein [Dehalococcoidia bacterium]